MKKTKTVSIIVPTYNEKENIRPLIEEIKKALGKNLLEVIVVDDDSPDKTWQIVQKIQGKHKFVNLYRRIKVRGLTSALNFGVRKVKGEIVGWLDADLSHPPECFPKMLEFLPKYDVAVASRYVEGGGDKRREKTAVIFSWLINRMAQIVINPAFKDYTSGFILAKKELFNHFKLCGDYGEYFIDAIAYFLKNSYKVREVPYICFSRQHGQSKTAGSFFDFLRRGRKYIWVIFKNFCKNDSS